VERGPVLNEVESAVRSGGHPQLVVNRVIRIHLCQELSHHDDVRVVFVARVLDPIHQHFAILFGDEHRGNADTTARAVVCHRNTGFPFFVYVVDHDAHRHADVLHVPHFLHEGAVSAALCQVKGTHVG